MADFTGMTVRLTLNQPPNIVLHGRVGEVVAGQTLTLQDVFFPASGARWDRWTVQGTAIADLQVVDTNATPTPPSTAYTHIPSPAAPRHFSGQQQQQPPVALPSRGESAQPHQPASDFVDPAILSYGKPSAPLRTASDPPVEPSTPMKSMLTKAAESLPGNTSPFVAEARNNVTKTVSQVEEPAQQKNSATPPVLPQTLNGGADSTQGGALTDTASKKKMRRGQRKKPTAAPLHDPPPVMNVEVSRHGNDMDTNVRRGKGWRQTPLLQPSSSGAPSNGGQKLSRKQQEKDQEMQQNGWATEDATDIQDLGDFDFEANHRLFDKKHVFDQLRQGDTTADEDRLVSHNKLHRPGTHGGKNLLPTENVLSPQLGPKTHSNELDSSSDADTELKFPNGRSSSRHSTTRTSLKKQPSRQNSTHVDVKPHPLSASFSLDRAPGINRSMTSLTSKSGKPVLSTSTSPRPERTQSTQSTISSTKVQTPKPAPLSQTWEPHFTITSSMTSCPVLLPIALETLESETIARYGLTQDAITESAARAVAEMAMSMLDGVGGSRRPSRAAAYHGRTTPSLNTDRNTPPVVVIIAGNHAEGARAVAAARHLVCRWTKIIVAEALYESSDTQHAQMKTQTAMIKRIMKTGANIKRGSWRKASNYIKSLSGPPAIIIDALLAGSTYESLRDSNAQHADEAQREAREMIDWANRSRAPVLSVSCPSGLSGEDGQAPLVEGEPLAIRPNKILCLGAPMRGLLDAMKTGEIWDVSLADIGINIALRSDDTVAFGTKWTTELKYMQDEAEAV